MRPPSINAHLIVVLPVFLWMAAALLPAQRTLRVPSQYPTIQAAIAIANNGDTVLVANGTYIGPISYASKQITLRSENGPERTVIDGQMAGPAVTINAVGGVLDGFTVQRGSGVRTMSSKNGCVGLTGCTRPVLVTLIRGGGVYAPATGVVVQNNIIENNKFDSPSGCAEGGGAWVGPGAVVSSNIFRFNSAGFTTSAAMFCPFLCNYVRFASEGGGLYCGDGSLVSGNQVVRNDASVTGGIYAAGLASTTIVNNVVSYNSGDGIGGFSGTVVNCTVVGNSGYGVRLFPLSGPSIQNSILRRNRGAVSQHNFSGPVTFSNVAGGSVGMGNFDLPAKMVADGRDDYHLQFDSPCRDAGAPAAVLPTTDYEGDPRAFGGFVDVGADEFAPHLYVTGTLRPGGQADVKIVGAPGSAVLLGYSFSPTLLSPPVVLPGIGAFYLSPPFFVVSLGQAPAIGVTLYSIRLPNGLPTPLVLPLQSLIGPSLTNPFSLVIR